MLSFEIMVILDWTSPLRFINSWPLEGAMYITLIFGGIPKLLVSCNFLQILMVSDKTIHRAFSTHTSL